MNTKFSEKIPKWYVYNTHAHMMMIQYVPYTAHVIIPSSMTTLKLHHFSHVIDDTNRLTTLKHGNISLGVQSTIVCVHVYTCVCA